MDEKTVFVFGLIALKLYLDSRKKLNKVIQRKKKKVLAKRAKKSEKTVKMEGFRLGDQRTKL